MSDSTITTLMATPEPWTTQAACHGLDPDLFFPERGDIAAVRAAKQVCTECPVAGECLEYAQAHNERDGIWGGLSGRERRALRAGRPPGPQPSPCGTRGAYDRHRRNGETPCDPCREAAALYMAKRRAA